MVRKRVFEANATIGAARAAELFPDAAGTAPAHEGSDDVVIHPESSLAGGADSDQANAYDEAARNASPWGSVIEHIARIDVGATYERLYSELSIGSGVTEYGTILAALDIADRNIVDCERLARAAKLEQESVDREVQTELEVMRTAARRELEAERERGERSKAPTIQDTDDRMLSNWPSRMSMLKGRSEEIHAARAVCEQLGIAWRSRASSLRSMADRYAARRDPTA